MWLPELDRPEVKEALEMARALSIHCQKHNIPKDAILYGVAVDVEHVLEQRLEKLKGDLHKTVDKLKL